MINSIKTYCDQLTKEFGRITDERKKILDQLTFYIQAKKKDNKTVNLVYICTHNSRRSHYGQVWGAVAASYYKIDNVHTFSGGTEETAFNINAINALNRIGFNVQREGEGRNPKYYVFFDNLEKPVICFSKVYDDQFNPSRQFLAIMTCGEAEENCPFIPGAELRIATTYEDPKSFDNTPLQDAKYDERCRQIALETFYVFSNLK